MEIILQLVDFLFNPSKEFMRQAALALFVLGAAVWIVLNSVLKAFVAKCIEFVKARRDS